MFKNYSLKNYNSFRVNHKANFFLKIENNTAIGEIKILKEKIVVLQDKLHHR